MNSPIRNLSWRDFLKLYKWINNKDINLFNRKTRKVNFIKHLKWFWKTSQNKNVIFRVIQDPLTLKAIGYCQLIRLQSDSKVCELRIKICEPTFHGKGLGYSALKNLIEIASESEFCNEIFLWVRQDNFKAVNLYKKLGFIISSKHEIGSFDDGEKKLFKMLLKSNFDVISGLPINLD